MASGATYKVPFRRRREGRTDYDQRLKLLKSGKPRLVARPSNRHVRAQFVVAAPEGDHVRASAHSSHLAEYGWEGPTANLPAAYLVGRLAGQRALAEDVDEAVLDVGLNHVTRGNKVFAVLHGATDAGVEVPHDESVLPSWERVRGEHIAEHAEYTAQDIDASELPEHVDDVLAAIEEGDA